MNNGPTGKMQSADEPGSSKSNFSVPKIAIAIVGGGLAGLAAAEALSDAVVRVELFEARRRLGGRAGSFRDPTTGELIDQCQHVSMGCCTNLADFCRRTGIADLFRRDRVLHFFSSDARRCDLKASRWLPAPLHFLPALLRLRYLGLKDRFRLGRALLRLARESAVDTKETPTIGQWLHDQKQSVAAVEGFWKPILVSALAETLDRVSLAAARKVMVDGLMVSRRGYVVDVPIVPLDELYSRRVGSWLAERKVNVHLNCPIRQVDGDETGATGITLQDGSQRTFDFVIVAVPWQQVLALLSEPIRKTLPELDRLDQFESSPISGVHLWFDRPITDLPHAVLVGRLSQWIFNRGEKATPGDDGDDGPATGHYYQVVISASRELAGRDRRQVVQQICEDLKSVFPKTRQAQLLHWRIVTEPCAVFSVRPGSDALRPPQQTAISNLVLAGDWTATGWPATMEGAVRSGRLAAESVLKTLGQKEKKLVPDLHRGWVARLLLGSK